MSSMPHLKTDNKVIHLVRMNAEKQAVLKEIDAAVDRVCRTVARAVMMAEQRKNGE